MTSFKLIFRNAHKNIRDYLIYFLTLTLSVSLFYAFNSISDQPAFSDMGITGSLYTTNSAYCCRRFLLSLR